MKYVYLYHLIWVKKLKTDSFKIPSNVVFVKSLDPGRILIDIFYMGYELCDELGCNFIQL